ncbi:hypothetical protein LX81_00229 [Palleronia aestuarii]|uniref:DUF2155 domain-containing protein n=1 Tax=Palleronia aestuarii TaxID=568105 RepID=A0A2W7NHN8_9RHOB|nr:DUF2155 domain-containing protein [Palleronia aestuarii]PZX19768.1 hypothetical protein LX81_00229 [Palleronia aestuarii]
MVARVKLQVAAFALCTCAAAASAQIDTRVAEAPGAVLRGLDKMTGAVRDLSVEVGETTALGRLQVTLGECRYPENNPAGNAFAYLVIRETGVDQPTFAGWMIAASPALNALEHPRYDLWVMRCST